ncbi:zinc transporter ZIP3 [Scaptodrosophila lebanonensis]|uniref:Zinc transporter ZIP3 n=1 Tax=Drosophila lebanonensis TaxID=7225 RepID=A0A6J2UDD2_DROLE|nr:zinc transporter ZIP3 [Scaptodrosophila lebanonensis]
MEARLGNTSIVGGSANINGRESTAAQDEHSLIVAKIVAMVVLIVVTIICGGLPYLLDHRFKWTKRDPEDTRSSTVVRCLLYFGGGVLVCTAFLHMLPEVIEVVELLQRCGTLAKTPFALPEMLMCTGFFLMYLLEQIMHTFVHRHQKKLSRKESLASAAFERGHSGRRSALQIPQDIQKSSGQHQSATAEFGNGEHCHSHLPIGAKSESVGSSVRGLGIILALSLHELFEGMAIGLENTVGTVWFMFGAVAAHKLVLAFCVGMELLVAQTRTALAIIYIITFSIMTPIGIGIGIAISNSGSANSTDVPSGILQGIATGTIIYVVFFEILTENQSGWRSYFSALAGFILMFGLQILSDEAEGEDSDSCS